jgi:hypothetical protein
MTQQSRIDQLISQGVNGTAAQRIISLQDQCEQLRAVISEMRLDLSWIQAQIDAGRLGKFKITLIEGDDNE